MKLCARHLAFGVSLSLVLLLPFTAPRTPASARGDDAHSPAPRAAQDNPAQPVTAPQAQPDIAASLEEVRRAEREFEDAQRLAALKGFGIGGNIIGPSVATIDLGPDLQRAYGRYVAVLTRFADAVPLSAEARNLQAEAASLQQVLSEQTDAAETDRALDRLVVIAERLEAEPGVEQVKSTLAAQSPGLLTLAAAAPAAPPATSGFGSLRRGDILLGRFPGNISLKTFLYAMFYTHAGNYDGNDLVYESNADGVRLRRLSDWQQPGVNVALGRNKKKSGGEVERALDWAKERFRTDGHTLYNYNFADKETEARLYCSQLTWKIHNRLGVNLDSNDYRYLAWLSGKWGGQAVAIGLLAVAPDEIALSDNVNIYYRR